MLIKSTRDFLSQQNTDWMKAGTEIKPAEAAPIDLHRLANPYEIKNYHKVPAAQPGQPQPATESSRPGVVQPQSFASRNQQQALDEVEKQRRTANQQGRGSREPSPKPVEVFLTQQEEQRRKRDQLKLQLDQQAQEDRERKEKLKRDQVVQDAYWEEKAQREQEKIYQRYRQEEEDLKLKRAGLPLGSKLQEGIDERGVLRSANPPDRQAGGQFQPRNQPSQSGGPAKFNLNTNSKGLLMSSLEKNGMSFEELQQLIRRGALSSAISNNQSRDREDLNSQDSKKQAEGRSRSPSPVLARIDNIKEDQDLLKLKSRDFEEELEKFMKFKSDQNKLRGGQGPQKPYYDYLNMYKTYLYPIGDPNSTRMYKPPGKDGISVMLGQNLSQDAGTERLVQPQYGVRVLEEARIPRLGPDPNRAVGRPSARENPRIGNKTDQELNMLDRIGFDQMTSYRDLNKKLAGQKLESEVRQELITAMNKGKQLSMAGMNPAARLTRIAAVTTGVRGVAIPALDFERDQIARQEAEEKYKDLVLTATIGSQDVAVLEYEVNRQKRRQSFHIPEGLTLEQVEPGQETDQIQRVLEEIEGLV